ncbi:Rab-3A-interacting protein [Trichoplax sp. H2]|nr:Rab-3A-interacting protein [Trichoplax sp. H2]|eukprot:RDD41152.1 Rab-3A-interacting protein [Trichoplax sp. H2]
MEKAIVSNSNQSLDHELVGTKPRSLTFSAPECLRPKALETLNGHNVSSAASNRSPSPSFVEVKALAQAKLKDELKRYQEELKLKDEEVTKLSKVKDQINEEVEELTASLFEEANSMVLEANIKQATAEKKLVEAQNKIEALETEIVALKQVLESTENHSQGHSDKHRRNLTNPFRQFSNKFSSKNKRNQEIPSIFENEIPEVDSVYYGEFLQWLDNPDLDYAKPFLARIYGEDILTCLELSNKNLTQIVQRAIERSTFHMEALIDPIIREDALNGIKQKCKYRIKCTDDSEDWLYIGQNTRNRVN